MRKQRANHVIRSKERWTYPWSLWLSVPENATEGTLRTLTKGVHFKTTMKNFRVRLHVAARKAGVHYRSHIVNKVTLTIQPYRKTSALDALEATRHPEIIPVRDWAEVARSIDNL